MQPMAVFRYEGRTRLKESSVKFMFRFRSLSTRIQDGEHQIGSRHRSGNTALTSRTQSLPPSESDKNEHTSVQKTFTALRILVSPIRKCRNPGPWKTFFSFFFHFVDFRCVLHAGNSQGRVLRVRDTVAARLYCLSMASSPMK